MNKEIPRKIPKHFELHDNENGLDHNLQETARAELGGKFIILNAYIRGKQPRINDFCHIHSRNLVKENQTQNKQRKHVTKSKISEIQNKTKTKTSR